MRTARDDLRLLSILHWVLAALSATFGLGYVAFLAFSASVFGEPFALGDSPALLFLGMTAVMVLVQFAHALLLALAARNLAAGRALTFNMVVAALSCVSVPLGTMLGAFTLYTLSRQDVKEVFTAGAPG